MTAVIGLLAALGVGGLSALIPIFNAEAYAIGAVVAQPWLVVGLVIALALGQSIGKMVLYETGRRGGQRIAVLRKANETAVGQRVSRGLSQPRTGAPLVLASSALGLPPLALVSVAAGAAEQNRRTFFLLCITGRLIRFTAIAVPALLTVGHLPGSGN